MKGIGPCFATLQDKEESNLIHFKCCLKSLEPSLWLRVAKMEFKSQFVENKIQ